MSPTEFKLLRYLMLNPNRVLSKAQILDHVWDYDFRGERGIVESYISYLRRKIDTVEPAAHPHQARRRLRAAAPPGHAGGVSTTDSPDGGPRLAAGWRGAVRGIPLRVRLLTVVAVLLAAALAGEQPHRHAC